MDTPIGEKPAVDLRDYLAEERTFLAWIRTGLTLMGFGFVVARFGLFLQMMQITRGDRRSAVPRTVPLDRNRIDCRRRGRESLVDTASSATG
jgi:uncharacterized membrane protein YidH (DUF202 family)